MSAITLCPIIPALALAAPLGAICAIGAVSLTSLACYNTSQVSSERLGNQILWSLCALPLVFVNPPLAFAIQAIILKIYPLLVDNTTLTITNCSTPEEVQAQMNTLSVAEQQNITVITLNNCVALRAIPENLFQNCRNLQEASFSNCPALTVIPPNLFQNCSDLQTAIFNNCRYFETIPPYLFQKCPDLQQACPYKPTKFDPHTPFHLYSRYQWMLWSFSCCPSEIAH